MTPVTCASCKCEFGIPDSLEISARRTDKINFFCPFGHSNHYPVGESEETKLRRARDRAVQEQARLQEELNKAEYRAVLAERATKRIKKRASAGNCPCCQRTFSNMARHMKHQHPEFVKESGAKVVPIRDKEKVA